MRISDWSSDVCSSDLHADVDSALAEDAVVGEQNLYVVDHLGAGVAEAQDVVDEAGRQVLVHTAGPEVGRVHARSADPLVELHQLLALFEAPQQRRHGADVESEGGRSAEHTSEL